MFRPTARPSMPVKTKVPPAGMDEDVSECRSSGCGQIQTPVRMGDSSGEVVASTELNEQTGLRPDLVIPAARFVQSPDFVPPGLDILTKRVGSDDTKVDLE